jgi:antitoxin ParD1/3/4
MTDKQPTNVSLSPHQEALVRSLVAEGRYQTASDVVCDGLRLLEEAEHRRLADKWLEEGLSEEEQSRLPKQLRERLQNQVKELIDVALKDVEAGYVESGPAVMERLERQLQGRPE